MHDCMLSLSVVSDSLQAHGLQPARLLCPWDLLGKNTGVDRLFHLHEIFPTQDSIPLRYLGNPIFTLFVGKPRSYKTSRQRAVPTSCHGKWHSVLGVWCVPQACLWPCLDSLLWDSGVLTISAKRLSPSSMHSIDTHVGHKRISAFVLLGNILFE